jgi:hypothetical protein
MRSLKKSIKKRYISKRSQMSGGAKRRTRNTRSGKKSLNNYFKLMLNAKKQNLSSFVYNKKKYIGTKHKHLGMIYRKQ